MLKLFAGAVEITPPVFLLPSLQVASNKKLLQTKDPNINASATKIATTFGTNRTYVNEANKPKKNNAIRKSLIFIWRVIQIKK